MNTWICRHCGTEYSESATPPPECPLCSNSRSTRSLEPSIWTTMSALRHEGHSMEVGIVADELLEIRTTPSFAQNRRALFVHTPHGTVLWDPPEYIDERAVESIRLLGGASAISASDPHAYGAMIRWAHALGNIPVYLPLSDRGWIQRPDSLIEFYETILDPAPGLKLISCGGPYPGSAVLLAEGTSDRAGLLCTGRTLRVTPNRNHVGFMYNYEEFIPLHPEVVESILTVVAPLPFGRIYDGYPGGDMVSLAKTAFIRSAQRHLDAVGAGEMKSFAGGA